MKELLLLDSKNYDVRLPEIKRTAVRAIIIRDKNLLMTETNVYGTVKLPGGGVEKGEDYKTALCREVLEETGRHVIKGSITEFGYVEEKRKSVKEEKIWHQFNYYYLAEIDDAVDDTRYTESEKKYDFHPIWINIDNAINKNENMVNRQGKLAWNQREAIVLKIIKEKLFEIS